MNDSASVSVPLPKPTRWKRAWEWLWRGQAFAAARAAQSVRSQLAQQQARARVAAEVAERTLNPSEPLLSGDASHLAAALFAESIGWSLRAAATSSAAEAGPDPSMKPPAHAELERLLTEQAALLRDVAGDDASHARVARHLLERQFETVPVVAADAEQVARDLWRVATRLLERVDSTQLAVDRVVVQRSSRFGGLILLLLAALPAIWYLPGYWEVRSDLTRGKPWRTSSVGESICLSPAHRCGQKQSYFFHTKEEDSPWLEVDLTRAEQFSRAVVLNRRDCCSERVVPLVVEVSADHHSWREVARTTQIFEEWKPKFSKVSARWVRVRIARRSTLHLYDLRVLR